MMGMSCFCMLFEVYDLDLAGTKVIFRGNYLYWVKMHYFKNTAGDIQ